MSGMASTWVAMDVSLRLMVLDFGVLGELRLGERPYSDVTGD